MLLCGGKSRTFEPSLEDRILVFKKLSQFLSVKNFVCKINKMNREMKRTRDVCVVGTCEREEKLFL